jgi:hypothetical protein
LQSQQKSKRFGLVDVKSTCRCRGGFAIVRLPNENAAICEPGGATGSGSVVKKKIDEMCETLHNLASSLLTNKTLCQDAASSTE